MIWHRGARSLAFRVGLHTDVLVAGTSILIVILSRLAHLQLVWIEEAYGLAAAAELLRGKQLYQDVWFDKPPLYAWFYLLCGARAGWPLRILDIALILGCAGSLYALAARIWSRREALAAAALACFFLTFWIPSAVMAAAPDLLMFVPQVLAVLFAASRHPVLSGIAAGFAFMCNSKGLVALLAAALWSPRHIPQIFAGWTLVTVCGLAALPLREYWQQVWWWGFGYSRDTFVAEPLTEGIRRFMGWMGFHATLVVSGLFALHRERCRHLMLWAAIAGASVCAGWRFFPRYFLVLLPVTILLAARGLCIAPRVVRVGALGLLLIPAIRFGPRYFHLQNWSDTTLMADSHTASEILKKEAGGNADLLVWGYRPDLYVFSGLRAGTRFLDSQPLTGVLADRHITMSRPTFPELAAANRAQLKSTRPMFVVDGLGPLNSSLAIDHYSDLTSWLAGYQEIGRTNASVIYRRRKVQ